MLDRQIALLEAEPPAGLSWLVPALVAAAAASGALLFASVGEPMFAGLFLAGVVAMLVAAFVLERRSARAHGDRRAAAGARFRACRGDPQPVARRRRAERCQRAAVVGQRPLSGSVRRRRSPSNVGAAMRSRASCATCAPPPGATGRRAAGGIALRGRRAGRGRAGRRRAATCCCGGSSAASRDLLATLVKRIAGSKANCSRAAGCWPRRSTARAGSSPPTASSSSARSAAGRSDKPVHVRRPGR